MKLTTVTMVSVDGVMQGLGGPEEDRRDGFERGGWVTPLFDDEATTFLNQVYQRADAFLFGRRTYEIFAGSWGAVEDPSIHPIAAALNTKPKYVASTTLTDPKWSDTTVLSDDLATAIAELKARPGGELQVHGSGALIRWLLDNQLVDEITLFVWPVIIGQGTRLFPDSGPDTALSLVHSRSTPKGVTIQVYRPGGRPRHGTGTFHLERVSPDEATTAIPGRPPVVDLATWRTARDALLIREKAHTRAGDAIAAARRRLPMVEFDGTVEIVGPDGPVPFLDLFQRRDELVVYKHMWYDGAPHQGQCEGCTTAAWHLKDAVYLNARGVSFAIVTTGRWDEVASYVEFMGYTQPWYSVRDVDAPIGGEMGYITCFLRDGDRVFLTYSTTGRGNEAVNGSLDLLDMTPYGRGEAWEDKPDGWPEGRGPCWYWRSDADGNPTWGPTGRPVPQWTRPGVTPVETLGRRGEH